MITSVHSFSDAQKNSPGTSGVILLAAGLGSRMAGLNKMTALLDGEALVRRAACSALAAGVGPVVVVTGHEAESVREMLGGLDVVFAHNPDYAAGQATSLKAGLSALPEEVGAALVMFGDMPKVGAGLIQRLAAALDPEAGHLIALPAQAGRRGNPVVWSRRLFSDLRALEGDAGADEVIARHGEFVIEVPVEDDGAFIDVNTAEELEALQIRAIAARADIDAGPALDGMKAEDA